MGLELALSTELLIGLLILPFGAEVGYLLIVVERVLVPVTWCSTKINLLA